MLPCPSLSPGACSNSCPLSWWCYVTISSSAVTFSFRLQSFLASGSFPMSRLFSSGSQSIGVSASASVLSMNIQGWFPLELTGLISLQSKGLSRIFPSTTIQKHQFFSAQPSLWSNSHIHTWLLEKPYLWLDGPLLAKWCLCLLITVKVFHSFPSKKQESFNFMAAVTVWSDFGAQTKSLSISIVSPSICHGVMGPAAMILVFWMLSLFLKINHLLPQCLSLKWKESRNRVQNWFVNSKSVSW